MNVRSLFDLFKAFDRELSRIIYFFSEKTYIPLYVCIVPSYHLIQYHDCKCYAPSKIGFQGVSLKYFEGMKDHMYQVTLLIFLLVFLSRRLAEISRDCLHRG